MRLLFTFFIILAYQLATAQFVDYKIFPDNKIICKVKQKDEVETVQTWEGYTEIVHWEIRETKKPKIYDVTLYFSERPFIKRYKNAWIMNSSGREIKMTALSPNPFK